MRVAPRADADFTSLGAAAVYLTQHEQGPGPALQELIAKVQRAAGNRDPLLFPVDTGKRARDSAFRGYGLMPTGADGAYRFRTIRPVPYPGRTPHIRFAVEFRPVATEPV